MCASGKTIFANEIASLFPSRIIHLDDFYNPRGTIDLLKSNDGNINLKRFKEEIIDHINSKSLIYNVFSCKEQKIVSSIELPLTSLTIIEGSYSLNPYFGKYYDLSIFMKCDSQVQLERIKKRNSNNFNDFVCKWIVLENRYNNFYQIEKNSQIVIVNNI